LNTIERLLDGALALAFFALSFSAMPGCGSGPKPDPAEAKGTTGVHVVPVNIAVAGREHLSVTKTYSGTLEGEEQANIVAKISERVIGINIRVGAAVQAGQVTITLDKSGASSQYYQAEASFNNAEKTLQRMKSLYDEGAVSLQTLDGAQTAYEVAKANFGAARSAVELTTPIPGVVTALNVSLGDLTVPGAVLATIARNARMKVTLNINESDVVYLAMGSKVRVYSETNPDADVEGRIVQISRSADVRSRSFEIKALFANTRNRWFKPGMFCKVDVHISPAQQTLVIPNGAIQSDGVTSQVFVIRNGRSFRNIVQTGVTDGMNTEILSGISSGDTVATVGVNNLRDSTLVSIAGLSH
jgi:membrane fusion protein (multidrug efflux system)